ncbi:MAG: hypothetical protein PHH98_00980 [Candidatus Gracilibacteria bacterium]|nr:hypothetical protein [Candidatus Gracilibacteria bacterium]
MISYLVKIFSLLLFSFFILFYYYFVFPNHSENFDGYAGLFIVLGIIYAVYKYFQLEISKDKAVISLKSIVAYFLLTLFVVCLYFFSLGEKSIFLGFSLFFKIIFVSLLPISIYVISLGFGRKILSKLPDKENFKSFWLLEMLIGFISFITLIVTFGVFGFYNLYVVFLVLISFSIYSYKEFGEIYNSFINTSYTFDIKEGNYMKLFTSEIFTIFAFIVLSTGLLSIYRPFPVGWDDLGVYMNYPHLMAEAGNLLSLGAMYSWQTFTGIGYMFGTNVPAFFINISGLFLSYIVLVVVLSNLIKSVNPVKKSFFNLPVILSSLFIALPMVGFQSMKDLKLDEGLFFITVIALYFLYKYFVFIREKRKISIIYMFLIGIIVGFSFSIKFTALLLIVSIIGVLSFARLGIVGFLGYISLFFGIFTIGNLWRMMNVVVNPNSIVGFEKIFGLITIILGVIVLFYGFLKDKKLFIIYTKELALFLVGVFVILIPWIGKNINESYPNINVSTIIGGKSGDFSVDYETIYSKEEINSISNEKNSVRKKENAITTNEDLLRYFGYDSGILGFVYMPWNLTMQKNQGGEFTNIGFIFLALLPLIFVFLPYRKKYYFIFFIFIALLQFISYYPSNSKLIKSSDFSGISSGSLVGVVSSNSLVFTNEKNQDDIYDIDVNKYIDDTVIESGLVKEDIDNKTKEYITKLINEETTAEIKKLSEQTQEKYSELFQENSKIYVDKYQGFYDAIYQREFNTLSEQVKKAFYEELKLKVKDLSIGNGFTFIGLKLDNADFGLIKKLNQIYISNYVFAIGDVAKLNETLLKNNASSVEINKINEIWEANRSISGKMIDFFAKTNLPIGYIFIFLGFIVSTIYLLLTLKDGKLVYIFKLNLVFASLYTFLWLISAFGIVWYGITMYFSFLLMIGLGGFFLTSYKVNDNENTYLYKLLGSVVFISIIIIYFINSLIPYTFNNLKASSYEEFKNGQFSQASAIFLYHDDYKKALFTLNIDENKKEEFLKKYISEDVFSAVDKLEKRDINTIFDILNQLSVDPNFRVTAKRSLENLYKNIQNPIDEFKNKGKVYRIGTFLKYYISENNNRLYDDSLLFSFNDFIYNVDSNITIDRFKKVGIKYLLVDLNAATIDQSETHDLTARYEKLLKTFLNPNIELKETDSVCLQLALDLYKQNGDVNEYMKLSGINYDDFDSNGDKITRSIKRNYCATQIIKLIESNSINETTYPYLIKFKNQFENSAINITQIDNMIGMAYKAIFELK